jgi:cytochrome c biogenesis protein CcdA
VEWWVTFRECTRENSVTMLFFLISVLAGILTVLAPCILPLLPVVIGSAEGGERRVSRRSLVVIGSLSLSVIIFTLLLKTTTLLIAIPQSFWVFFSGTVLVLVGLAIMFPNVWSRIPYVAKVSSFGNRAIGSGYQKQNHTGDVIIGLALGPVFTTCSPTYLFIIATILPAGLVVGVVYLLGFVLGLALSLLLIAYFGGQLVGRITAHMTTANRVKQLFGILIVVVGLAILTGSDKKLETWILDSGYGATINFEEGLIERFAPVHISSTWPTAPGARQATPAFSVPSTLLRFFPDTDFGKADPRLVNALSGGPAKDGIPAIDAPMFVSLREWRHSDEVEVIVLVGDDEVKVYPYNILTWHEIVNDEIDGVPIAVTFCPLCGSAIVFNRTLPDGTVSTFGVSGSLLESNMIMYDRMTENLWQQSTGAVLAGSFYPATLALESFQLLTIAEVKRLYPQAKVLSEDTGHRRDYEQNPYAGYETDNRFVFEPSGIDATFPPKTIMAVFRDRGVTFAVPWLALRTAGQATNESNDVVYTLTATEGGELMVVDNFGTTHPFYFEMWFSVAVQHEIGALVVINP